MKATHGVFKKKRNGTKGFKIVTFIAGDDKLYVHSSLVSAVKTELSLYNCSCLPLCLSYNVTVALAAMSGDFKTMVKN